MTTSPFFIPQAFAVEIALPHHLQRPRESFLVRFRRLGKLLWAMAEDGNALDHLIFNVGGASIAVVAAKDNSAGASTTIDTQVFDPENWLIFNSRIAGYSSSQIAQCVHRTGIAGRLKDRGPNSCRL